MRRENEAGKESCRGGKMVRGEGTARRQDAEGPEKG